MALPTTRPSLTPPLPINSSRRRWSLMLTQGTSAPGWEGERRLSSSLGEFTLFSSLLEKPRDSASRYCPPPPGRLFLSDCQLVELIAHLPSTLHRRVLNTFGQRGKGGQARHTLAYLFLSHFSHPLPHRRSSTKPIAGEDISVKGR